MSIPRVLPVLVSRTVAVTGVVVVIGLLPWLSGAAAEYTILRARYSEQEASPEALAQVRAELGLDAGPWTLLGRWLAGLLRGDLGSSWVSHRPVGPGMVQALGVSLTLMGFSLAVATAVAALLLVRPMRAGLRGEVRRSAGITSAALSAVPSFLLASVLLVVVALWWRLLPPYGWQGPRHAVLPALAMGVPAGAYLGRLFADTVTGVWQEAWVQTWSIAQVARHRLVLAVLRRAAGTLVGQVALVVVGLTAEAVAVEQVFAIPGLGRALLGSAAAQDVPATRAGLVLVLALAVTVGVVAAVVRRLLIGPALAEGAAPVPKGGHGAARNATRISLGALALLAGLVAWGLPRDPYAPVHERLAPLSWALPLGADATGRDLLARVAHGALSTLGGAVLVSLATLVLGLLIGLAGRWATGFIEVANALPSLVVGLVVAAASGPSHLGAGIAVVVTGWAALAAHTRDLVGEVMARPYIRLQPTWGVGAARRLLGSVLPVVAPAVARHAVLRLPGRALELAALSFLGLGPRPPAPDWGLLLGEGLPYVERAPWAVLAPTVALMLAAVAALAAAAHGDR